MVGSCLYEHLILFFTVVNSTPCFRMIETALLVKMANFSVFVLTVSTVITVLILQKLKKKPWLGLVSLYVY